MKANTDQERSVEQAREKARRRAAFLMETPTFPLWGAHPLELLVMDILREEMRRRAIEQGKIAVAIPKKASTCAWLSDVRLTDKQYEIASLRYEREMSVAAIARYNGLHRKTVSQHLELVAQKCAQSR